MAQPEERNPMSRLARARAMRGVSQKQLAAAVGISVPTLRRLESGGMDNPPLRYLMNCALALGVDLDQVVEPSWRQWKVFDERAPEPPAREGFWRPGFVADLTRRGESA